MRIRGRTLRTAAAAAFNGGVLVALLGHAVESSWFWVPLAAVLWGAFAVIVGLELLHLLLPDDTDRWGDGR